MGVNLGVHVYEKATAVSTPVVADAGIPFVVGLAPAHAAASPAKANVPVLATSWDEAVEKLGFSYDWKTYTLCEFMYSHFQLYGCQPVIFCNVLDAATMKETVAARSYGVVDHRVFLPYGAIRDSIVATPDDGTAEIISAVNTAVTERVGQKDGLTGCTLEFNQSAQKLTVTLTGPLSEVKNTGIFDTLTALIEEGYTVTVDGTAITNLASFKKTAAYARLAALEQGGESVIFYAAVGTGEGPEVSYTIVVSYPDAATRAEDDAAEGETAAVKPALQEDIDYTILYDSDSDNCVIELLPDGAAYDASSLIVAYDAARPGDVSTVDIVMGLGMVDACMTSVGVIPDLICAPGYSHITTVAAVMATKADGINGLFRAKALIDCDSSKNGVREYSGLTAYKNKNNFVDENLILCWPMVKLGDYIFHLSTQLVGLLAQVDTLNGGCPYESPSNKNLKMDACCLEDGTEVDLTWEQVQLIAGSYGVVTALNFMSMGWVAKGNYTACYPANTDIKDQFIPVSRVFDWVANTVIRTFWSKLDKPVNLTLAGNVQDTCTLWLNGLCGSGYLLGARVEVLESENPLTDMQNGIIRFHIYIAPPPPAQEIDFYLEYDVSYLTAAFAA